MSQYLNSYADSIPLAYSILQTQNVLVGNLTANGWQLLAQVDGDHSDLIPPSSETIGTSKFREVVRIYFPNNTTISIGSYQACIADAYPQAFRLTAKTGGAVQAGVTINGVQVLGTVGSSGSTGNDNLRALYYALKDSINSTITGWDYWYNGSDTLIGTCKTAVAAVTVSGNANVNYYAHAAPVLSGARSGYVNVDATLAYTVSMDLTNGFVYCMDVYSRSFKLSTKTLGGSYGPIFAAYSDHSAALAALPASPYCTPIELWVGSTSDANQLGYARPTHYWAVPSQWGNISVSNIDTLDWNGYPKVSVEAHAWTGHGAPNNLIDAPILNSRFSGSSNIVEAIAPATLAKLGMIAGASPLDTDFKLGPLVSQDAAYNLSGGSGGGYPLSVRYSPFVDFPDIYKWYGSEPNEACAWCVIPANPGYSDSPITVQQAVDDTSTYSSLTISTTTGLRASGGSFLLGDEKWNYAGISGGTTVTGCVRAQDGTVMRRHFVGDVLRPGLWFLKVNNGAISFDANKPV